MWEEEKVNPFEVHHTSEAKNVNKQNPFKLFNIDIHKERKKNHKILTSVQVILDLRKQRNLDQQLQKSHSVENDDLVKAAHDKLDAEINKIQVHKIFNKERNSQEYKAFKSLAIKAHEELKEEVEKAIANKQKTPFAEFHKIFSPTTDKSEKVKKNEDNVEYIDPKVLLGLPMKSLYSIVNDLLKKYFK